METIENTGFSNDNTIAVIDFVLNDLCCPAFECMALLLPVDVEIFYLDFFVARAFSCASQGKTAFLCLIFPFSGNDNGIEHGNIHETHADRNDTFFHTDHIRRQTHTAGFVCLQGV